MGKAKAELCDRCCHHTRLNSGYTLVCALRYEQVWAEWDKTRADNAYTMVIDGSSIERDDFTIPSECPFVLEQIIYGQS